MIRVFKQVLILACISTTSVSAAPTAQEEPLHAKDEFEKEIISPSLCLALLQWQILTCEFLYPEIHSAGVSEHTSCIWQAHVCYNQCSSLLGTPIEDFNCSVLPPPAQPPGLEHSVHPGLPLDLDE